MGLGLDWLADEDNAERVRALARGRCRGRYDLCDELWGVAVDRADRIGELWIPELGPLDPYMMANLGWYFFKWMNANAARLERYCAELPPDSAPEAPVASEPRALDHDEVQLVREVMGELSDYDRALLAMYYAQGLSYNEIAQMTGTSKGTARLHVMAALENARRLAGVS